METVEQVTKEFPTYTGPIRAGTVKYGKPCSVAINEFMEDFAAKDLRDIRVASIHSFKKQYEDSVSWWLLVVFNLGLINRDAVRVARLNQE